MAGRRLLLDTNILVTATSARRPRHLAARAVLEEWSAKGDRLYLSGQILREYLVVATRTAPQNGLGLSLADGLTNLDSFLSCCTSLEDTRAVQALLPRLLLDTSTSGKQVHDANIVATAMAHGLDGILTQNSEDFQRFRSYLPILDLPAATP